MARKGVIVSMKYYKLACGILMSTMAFCDDLKPDQVVFATGRAIRDCSILYAAVMQSEFVERMKDVCPNPICALDKAIYINDVSTELCVLCDTNAMHCCVITETGDVFSKSYALSRDERQIVQSVRNSFFWVDVYPNGSPIIPQPTVTLTIFGKGIRCCKSFSIPPTFSISEVLSYSSQVVEQVVKDKSRNNLSAVYSYNELLAFFGMAFAHVEEFIGKFRDSGIRPRFVREDNRFTPLAGRTDALDRRVVAVCALLDEVVYFGKGMPPASFSVEESDMMIRYNVQLNDGKGDVVIDVKKADGVFSFVDERMHR